MHRGPLMVALALEMSERSVEVIGGRQDLPQHRREARHVDLERDVVLAAHHVLHTVTGMT
jgi:hypothetical protein